MSNEALKPVFTNVPSLIKQKNSNPEASEEEQRLFTMSHSAGWKTFRDIAERASKELDDINKQAIAGGASFEEIGRNTLVISMTQDIIKRLLNKVDDAVEACENDGSK